MRRRGNKETDAALGCVIYALLGVFLMPVVGLFLACSKDRNKSLWGLVLLVVGIVLWIIIGVGSA